MYYRDRRESITGIKFTVEELDGKPASGLLMAQMSPASRALSGKLKAVRSSGGMFLALIGSNGKAWPLNNVNARQLREDAVGRFYFQSDDDRDREAPTDYFHWNNGSDGNLLTFHERTIVFRLPRCGDGLSKNGLGRLSVIQMHGDPSRFAVAIAHPVAIDITGKGTYEHISLSKGVVKMIRNGVPANGYDYLIEASHLNLAEVQ